MTDSSDTPAQDREAALSWRALVGRRSDHASALLARLMRGRSRDSAVLLLACGTVFTLTVPLLMWAAMAVLGLRDGMAASCAGVLGPANRRDLDARLGALRDGDTVVICDLDRFKALNDRWGHTAGDRVLADLGTLLRTGLREGDHAARHGGEGFALLLPASTAAQAGAVTDRLRERWALPQPGTTFSAGTATLTPGTGRATTPSSAAPRCTWPRPRGATAPATPASCSGRGRLRAEVRRRGRPLAYRGEGAHTGRTRLPRGAHRAPPRPDLRAALDARALARTPPHPSQGGVLHGDGLLPGR